MAEDFLSDRFNSDQPPHSSQSSRPDREAVRIIVVSSRSGVTRTIQTLHHKNVANITEWSELQPEPMTGKWMSVVTKYIQRE